jgi:hypothetical protein
MGMLRGRSLVAVVAVMGSLAVAAAQDASAPQPDGPAAAPAPAAPQSPGEQVAAGQQVVRQGEALSQRIRGLLEQARRESDIIRVTCLNDKLTQVNANLRTASQRAEALQKAADPDLRNHESTVLGVLAQKFGVLDQEAGQCVGQDMFNTGTTRVTTEIDEATIPDESPDNLPVIMSPSNVLFGAPPPPASGTL